MKMVPKILIVLIAALSPTLAGACPPCDEPWPGTNTCSPEDRFQYCCLQTDQCYLEDGPFDPWPFQLTSLASVDGSVEVASEANATGEASQPETETETEAETGSGEASSDTTPTL